MIRALVADDETLVRKGIITIMPWAKFAIDIVGEASNGRRALELMAHQPVDLLFTDLMMPEMSGMELIREVRVKYPHVQFVVLTCYPEFEYVQEALRLGAIDYILKTQLENARMEDVLSNIVERFHERKKGGNHHANPGGPPASRPVRYADDIVRSIQDIMAYIEQQAELQFTQEQLARRANMSRGYFSQCFKDIAGVGFHEYVKEIRLVRARTLLETTSLPIYLIAERAGFKDEKYFSRMFQTEVGMLPSDYRNNRG
ncbi:response regulator transcription factor [Paenibacillus pinihumi]|uniref:response regulator transcription factor n=1 Tax=Paenibacillus pinihumi TaxID=669462 RepID=UPI000420182C|nr:helix-turn-helix domain-containing protein [Paenibacillus pinihumi]